MELDLTTVEGRRQQGQLILQAIREAGLSVEQVARDIGCSRALLYQYIAGTTLAQPDRLTQIAQRTGKPLAFFYGADISEPSEIAERRRALDEERARWERQQADERDRRLRERMDMLTALGDALSQPPDLKRAMETYEQVLPIAREMADQRMEATALYKIGTIRLLTGDLESSLSVLTTALSLFQGLEDVSSALAVRQAIGRALLVMGRPDEAEKHFRSVAESDQWSRRWLGLIALSALAEWTGDLKGAMDWLDKASEEEAGAPSEKECQILSLFLSANRANVYLACGDFTESARLASDALLLAERLNDRDQYLEALLTLAVTSHHLGHWVAAHRYTSRARSLAQFIEDRERTALADAVLSGLCAAVGDFPTAKESGMRALTASLRLRSLRCQVWAHRSLAVTHLKEESPDDARYHIESLRSLSQEMKNKAEALYSDALFAWFHLLKGDREMARHFSESVFKEADDAGMRHLCVLALFVAACALRPEHPDQGWDRLREAVRLASEIGWQEFLWRLKALQCRWLAEEGKTQEALTGCHRIFDQLAHWRAEWTGEGYDDTWMEDPLVFQTSLLYARLTEQTAGREPADQLIASLGWLPLVEAWQKLMGDRR